MYYIMIMGSCAAQGHLGPEEFEIVMREQLRLYTQA